MDEGITTRILAAYGITGGTVLPPQKGYRNSAFPVITPGGMLNLIVYKNEQGMRARVTRANAVGNYLHANGLPARRTFDQRIIELKNVRQTRFAALYYYLPGVTIPWEAYTMERIKSLGKALSDVHTLLKNYPGELPSVADELLALNTRMVRYFANTNVQSALTQKLSITVVASNFTSAITAAKKLPGQALHMDFVRGNLLFDGDTITGILDFEKTAYGHPVFDVARTLAFLLVDCKYMPAGKTGNYFVRSGYNKRGNAQFTAFAELKRLLPFFLLHDFYKFLRHNPYEYLPHNRHFVRTTKILAKHGVLSVK